MEQPEEARVRLTRVSGARRRDPSSVSCPDKEVVGDHVTMEVREIVDNYGDIIVRAKYDGTYDKTNLPDELILSSYFSISDEKILSLTIIFNEPSPY